jgi:hypothetical protein
MSDTSSVGLCLIRLSFKREYDPPPAMTTTAIATWLCKCGVTVKVKTEAKRTQPMITVQATCPNCGDQQTVYGHHIVSVTHELVRSPGATRR